MKKLLLCTFLAALTINSIAQVTSLNENFNSYCAVLGENYPTYWSAYNNTFNPLVTWTCGPTDGRGPTPGIKCSNYDGLGYIVDTAWLFTPQLNLSFYTGSIYLQFDTRYLSAAARLSVLVSNNYIGGSPPDTSVFGDTWSDLTSSSTPVLSDDGDATWVTHQVDLTPYKATPLYVAFRYISDNTGTGTWFIDNVLTTQIGLSVSELNANKLSLNVVGSSTSNQIRFSYNAPNAGIYKISLYDMVGRNVFSGTIETQPGPAAYTLSDLDLTSGLYLLKMADGLEYSTVKVMIR